MNNKFSTTNDKLRADEQHKYSRRKRTLTTHPAPMLIDGVGPTSEIRHHVLLAGTFLALLCLIVGCLVGVRLGSTVLGADDQADTQTAKQANTTKASSNSSTAHAATAEKPNKQLSQRHTDVFIGDSLTACMDVEKSSCWVTKLTKALGDTPKNYAISGYGWGATDADSTASGSFSIQIDRASTELAGQKDQVRYVFITGFINDYFYKKRVPASQLGTLAYGTIQKAKREFMGAQVVVIPSIWLHSDYLERLWRDEDISDYAEAVITAAKQLDVPVATDYRQWLAGASGICLNGSCDYEVHPNAAGYAIVADKVEQWLKSL